MRLNLSLQRPVADRDAVLLPATCSESPPPSQVSALAPGGGGRPGTNPAPGLGNLKESSMSLQVHQPAARRVQPATMPATPENLPVREGNGGSPRVNVLPGTMKERPRNGGGLPGGQRSQRGERPFMPG